MTWLMGFAYLFVLALGAAPEAEASQRLEDYVVADVEGQVITFSEVVSEARFALLRAQGPEHAARTALTPELLRAVLRGSVQRALILGELRRLQLARVPGSKRPSTWARKASMEAPDKDAAKVADLVRELMEGIFPLEVPLVAQAHIGATWHEAH